MYPLNKNQIIIALTVLILLVPINVEATVPVSSGFASPEDAVLIAIHYEDASDTGHIFANLTQDLVALEYAFTSMLNEGKLDANFPKLVIVATKYYREDNRFETEPTVISFTDSASLVSIHPDSPQFKPKDLGRAYVIKTSLGLLNYEDIIATMLKLSDLNEKNRSIEIKNEEELNILKARPEFKRFMNFQIEGQKSETASGGKVITSSWKAGITHYFLSDEAGNIITEFKTAVTYLAKPSWPPLERTELQGRILAFASDEEVFIYDVHNDIYHTLNLDFQFDDASNKDIFMGMENIQGVGFAVHTKEDKIYVLPFLRMGVLNIIYSLDLNTDEWIRVAEGWEASDMYFENIESKLWIEFVPALPNRRSMNIDVVTKDWTIGQNAPFGDNMVSEEKPQPDDSVPVEKKPMQDEIATESDGLAQETEKPNRVHNGNSVLWLVLPIIAAITILIYIKRKSLFSK